MVEITQKEDETVTYYSVTIDFQGLGRPYNINSDKEWTRTHGECNRAIDDSEGERMRVERNTRK